MNDQKDLLEQFMHHNMPEKSIDPDEVFARTYQVLPDDYEPSKKFTRNMKKLLRKAKWVSYKNSVKRFFTKKGVPQIVVASMVVICCLVAVQANNGQLFSWLTQQHKTHTGILLMEQIQTSELKNKLDNAQMLIYFPKYVPTDYEIEKIDTAPSYFEITLKKGNAYIQILQKKLSSSQSEDFLNSETPLHNMEEVAINDFHGFFTQKEGQSFLYFSDNSNSFSICGDSLTKKEIISLAESLEPII